MTRMSNVEKGFIALVLFVLLGIASSRVESYDIFWQLQSGKYMWETGSFIRTDLFTLAPDVPRWEHCWLHDLIFFAVYSLAGYTGLSVIKGVLIASASAVLMAAARVRGASNLSLLFLGVPSILLTSWSWLDRPQLWSFLLFALFIYLLERYKRNGGRSIWFLFPLMVLWVNLHAGAVLGIAVTGAYVGGEALARISKRIRSEIRLKGLLISFLLLFVALLATPYGLTPLKVLFQVGNLGSASGATSQVYNYDWQPTTFAGFSSFYYAGGAALFLLIAGMKRFSPRDLLLLGGLWYMGSTLARHVPFFMLGAAAILPVYADTIIDALKGKIRKLSSTTLRRCAYLAASAAIIYLASPVYRANGFFDTGFTAWHWPVKAAEFIRQNGLPGNLFNTYNYGEYLSWTLYPDYKVFFDSRQDSPEMFKKGLQVSYGIIGWEGVLDDYDVNTVVTKACTTFPSERYPLIDRLSESPRWALVYADESSLVFVRRSSVESGWLTAQELPERRIYDTVLSEALLLIEENPSRYNAYWEAAQAYWIRREYPKAFQSLEAYFARAPKINPRAMKYYEMLLPMMERKINAVQ